MGGIYRCVCVCYLVGAAGEDVCVVLGFPHSSRQVELHVLNLNNTNVLSFVLDGGTERNFRTSAR